MDYSQFLMMPQELGLLVVILLVFLYDLFMPQSAQKYLPVFSCVMFLIYVAASCCITSVGTAFGGMIETTNATIAIKIILNVGAFIVMVQAAQWANSEYVAVRRGEFYTLLLITLLGMQFMISARHFLMFVIGLETASLPLAAMAAFEKNHYQSHEAAVKYMFTAIFSSSIMMMGISFVYGITGSLYYGDIAEKIATADGTALLFVALAFVLSGVGFKLSLVPFHLWTADVYQGAPTAVTSYLSVISKGSAAFAVFVIFSQAFGGTEIWTYMMYALIILTITIGNLFAIRQKNLKRFLAFSSISQAGYIMLGVIAQNAQGLGSLMFYVLVYIFSNLAAFGVIQAIENKTDKVGMDDYNGLYKTNPKLSFVMTLAMFSLAGIPPFAGFFSKFFIFSSALATGSVALYVLVLIALINTIPSLYYYLLVVKAMFINPNDNPIEKVETACSLKFALVVCLLGIMLTGIASCVYTSLINAAL